MNRAERRHPKKRVVQWPKWVGCSEVLERLLKRADPKWPCWQVAP